MNSEMKSSRIGQSTRPSRCRCGTSGWPGECAPPSARSIPWAPGRRRTRSRVTRMTRPLIVCSRLNGYAGASLPAAAPPADPARRAGRGQRPDDARKRTPGRRAPARGTRGVTSEAPARPPARSSCPAGSRLASPPRRCCWRWPARRGTGRVDLLRSSAAATTGAKTKQTMS